MPLVLLSLHLRRLVEGELLVWSLLLRSPRVRMPLLPLLCLLLVLVVVLLLPLLCRLYRL
jgi:hypothetical protein